MTSVRKVCPVCHMETGIRVPENVALKYYESRMGNGLIEDLPTSEENKYFFKTGICMACVGNAKKIIRRYA